METEVQKLSNVKIKLLLLALLIPYSCSTTKITGEMTNTHAPLIIYKTTADFYTNVPVTLNAGKDKIVSFPGVSDLRSKDEFLLPVKLKKGFLLDRRGINAHSVFTKYTYQEYAAMDAPPSPGELFESIVEMNPFIVIYDCGKIKDTKDIIKQLNDIIKNDCKSCMEMKLDN